ncbi:MAG: alpha/beta hydrolase [Pseudomonadota bacterium]
MDFPDGELIPVNGVELEVFTAGDPAGRPLVLSHGWPEHAFSWRHFIQPLVDEGYFLIVPNQRGYGRSSCPERVEDYAIEYLTGDLVALAEHFGHEQAFYLGHDWGAIIVWNLAMMHRDRLAGLINLSVPFMERGPTEWIDFWEQVLGSDFYMVHFNRQPGVADAIFQSNSEGFLRNVFKKNQWLHPKAELQGMAFIAMAESDSLPGDPVMSDEELQVFIDGFALSGYHGGINWYRNFTRNWHTIGAYEQIVEQPALMIRGEFDMVPMTKNMRAFVPNAEVKELPCGHWIQQEMPEEVLALALPFLKQHYPSK